MSVARLAARLGLLLAVSLSIVHFEFESAPPHRPSLILREVRDAPSTPPFRVERKTS